MLVLVSTAREAVVIAVLPAMSEWYLISPQQSTLIHNMVSCARARRTPPCTCAHKYALTCSDAHRHVCTCVHAIHTHSYTQARAHTHRSMRMCARAGANCTYTIEAMMGDRRALQAGTSHNLGDNFAKVGAHGKKAGTLRRHNLPSRPAHCITSGTTFQGGGTCS